MDIARSHELDTTTVTVADDIENTEDDTRVQQSTKSILDTVQVNSFIIYKTVHAGEKIV